MTRAEAIVNFWMKVKKTDDCWMWTRAKELGGYGVTWDGERLVRAHRFSWALANGEIPPGMFVCHRCDNRACVRPEHLFLGTHADNMRDMVKKGRTKRGLNGGWATHPESRPRGEQHHASKITADDVRAIRKLRDTLSQAEIARRWGLDPSTVSQIQSFKRWKHVR